MPSRDSGPTESISTEQSYVDMVYARLDTLRAQTRDRLAQVRREGPSGSPQNRSERDAFATLYEDRLAALDAVEERLVFGRLDLDSGERRYVGRIGMSDVDHAPILTDWRAPAARAFYQATAHHRGDVVLRRHLQTRGRTVLAVEDDVLDLDALDDTTQLQLSGEGALMAALGASRTGRMGDIVATIQSEQDAIIRSDLDGVLVVQGGPGTGKTAVALHRAAYLLYAHRQRLERSGVLLIGPSRVFLRYIEQVLPALGETGVVASTMADLVPGVAATGTEDPALVEIKGRSAWAGIIERAIKARQRVLPEREMDVSGVTLVLRPAQVRDAQARARRSGQPHNRARVTFVRAMLTALATQYLEQIGGNGEDPATVVEEIRSARDVRIALNLCWMPLTATGLIADLYAKPHRLAEVAGRLSPAERDLLRRDKRAPWTPADVPLIDEAAELIGEDSETERAQERLAAVRQERDLAYAKQVIDGSGAGGGMVSAETLAARFAETGPRLTTAERAYGDRSWTFGHIVVDEAQELSAMAWRALLRRCPTRSMTVVGDVAQTSSAAGAKEWGAMLNPLLRGSWTSAHLTVNYRTPASVMDAAERVATAADPDNPPQPLTSAREVEDAVVVERVRDLADGVHRAVTAERELADGGSIAVIAATGRHEELAGHLGLRTAQQRDLTQDVVLLEPTGAKGLEFDRVVLVEPAELLEAGIGDLYVAMTRPTQRLRVVHSRDLPAGVVDVH